MLALTLVLFLFTHIWGGDMDIIKHFIWTETIILIPTLYFIGLFLRETPIFPIWTHAWLQLAIATVACFLRFGFIIEAFVQAVLVTGVAVLSKDLIHKTLDRTQDKEDDRKH